MKKFAYFAAVSIAVIAQGASAQTVSLTGKVTGSFRANGRFEVYINGTTVDASQNVANGTMTLTRKVTKVEQLTGSINCAVSGPLPAPKYALITCTSGTSNVSGATRIPGRSEVRINGTTVDITQNLTNGTMILTTKVTAPLELSGNINCTASDPLPAPKYSSIVCTG
jgi:hypothetical protein